MLSGVDEEEHVDDEWDVSRTQQGDGFDLFEQEGDGPHSGANGSHRQNGESGDAHCGPGQNLQLDELLIGYVLTDKSSQRPSSLTQGLKVCWWTTSWPSRTWPSWP